MTTVNNGASVTDHDAGGRSSHPEEARLGILVAFPGIEAALSELRV
jgi:hypothetical protein